MCCYGFLQVVFGGCRIPLGGAIQPKGRVQVGQALYIRSRNYLEKNGALTKFLIITSTSLWCLLSTLVGYSVPPHSLWNVETLLVGSRYPAYLGKTTFPRQNASLPRILN